ncbi:DUF6531 domain-containing protein [Butyrivibrio fibrisolvens]|uniref:RHS repeat-associated core domain-containing protein n=1 Tax=Butyrivibrio fibrisolvens TaxID=831 RepID=A0A317FVL8_BUTFI|nr:DUF6531 domain-containing protein [Butyrivibrio fibrisolvens]PWT25765.1 hypothetical protein CPT75_01350 [Butyrivibrio fibrisolvens]
MAGDNGELTWDQAKLAEYFTACQEKYNTFLSMSDTLILKFKAFVDDDTHTGPEAEAAKAFIQDYQIKMIEDLVWVIQEFMTKQDELLENFKDEVTEDDTARMKLSRLEEIINDFETYISNFETVSDDIEEVYQGLVSGCSIAGVEFTQPLPGNTKTYFGFITRNGSTEGRVPKTKNCLSSFNDTHANEITGSEIDSFLADIESNLKGFLELTSQQLQDTVLNYSDTTLLPWYKDPSSSLDEATKQEYDTYMQNMADYLNGNKERCEVYKYDPVNMCTGNYINEHEDLKIGGLYPLTFKRFYNALPSSKEDFILGNGWSTTYSEHLTRDEEGIRISYADGSIGLYKERIIKGKKYYEEIHGEPGLLSEIEDDSESTAEEIIKKKTYILRQDNGQYKKFDDNGYLVELGDDNGAVAELLYTNVKTAEEKSVKRLASVKTPGIAALFFTYNEYGNITSLKDHTGRVVKYTYKSVSEPDDPKSVQVLESVTYADGTTASYDYSKDGKISEVTNQRGIKSITNTYDSQGRTIKQSFPDGGVMTYAYDDKKRTTKATEQNGNKVVYKHDAKMRHTGTKYYDGEESFTYNKRNQKISHTNKLGYTTRYTYDNRGHLTSIIDPMGHKTCMTYNADGRLMALKDPKGNSYKYTYDIQGNLFEIKDPLGNKKRFYYTGRYLKKVKDEEGNITLLSYDAEGNVSCITDPEGVKTFYEYDSLGRVIKTSDIEGNTKKYTYDDADRLTSVTDALGNRTSYEYNESGKVTKITNPDGTSKTWEYNIIGKPCKVTDEAGRVTNVDYNSMWKEEKITLPNSGTILYEYDPLMRIKKVTDPEGRTTGYDYDKNGNVLARYLGDIKVNSRKYNALNQVIKETDALGHEKTYEYDENGKITVVTDTLGNKYTRDYNELGKVVRQTDPLGNESAYTYTKSGAIETVTDPAGRVRKFEYTKSGKLHAVYFCGRKDQELIYDNAGRVEKRTFADGYTISYSYDALNRVVKVEGSDGRTASYEYDAMGRATKVSDGRSTTLYTYTATGKLKSVVDALGNETAYTYDELDNLKSIHRAEGLVSEEEKNDDNFPKVGKDGHITLYSYNLAGQLTKVTDALGQEETYEYDQYGRLITKTDRDSFDTTYEYNDLGAVTKVGYADGRSVAFSYDELNHLSEINDWLGKTTLENDIFGRLSKVTDYQDRTVTYEYNALGAKTSLTYPDGRQALYSYDEEGKLSSITAKGIEENSNEHTSYSYDELGRLIEKLLPNGVRQDYSYLPGGNIESMTSFDKEGILDKYFYSYDNSGLISGINRERRNLDAISGQYDYQYDEIGRLTRSSLNGELRASYEYDAFGNRTSLVESNAQTTYRYDSLDRLVEAKELNNSQAIVRSYDYDKRGNQTNEYVDGLLNKTFTFDATNMLSKVVDSEKGELENQYNGLGFRVASIRPEERIEYLCDLSRDCYNMLERTVNGETESFIYDKNVISMSKAGDNYYYLQDELGSPMYMTGTDGAAVSLYAFDDFGRGIDPLTGKLKKRRNKYSNGIEESNHKHAYTTEGNIIQPFAFTGYQEDDISGLKFAQARFYDADTGRFQSEDLVKGFTNIPFTLNHYSYCFGCPIGFVDRNGQFLDWVVDKAKQAVDYVKENPKQVAIGAAVAAVGVGIAVAAAPLELSVGTVAAVGAISSAAIDAGFQEMTSGKIDVSEVVVSGVFGALTAGTLSVGAKNITDKATQWATSKLGQSVAKLGIESAITGIYGFAQSATNDIVNLFDNDKENDYDAEEIIVRGGVNGLLETGGSLLEGAFKGIAKKIVNRNTTNDVIQNKGELWETWEKWAENGTANQKRQGTKQITKYTRQALKAAEEYVENSWVGKTITGSTILGTNVAEQICTE